MEESIVKIYPKSNKTTVKSPLVLRAIFLACYTCAESVNPHLSVVERISKAATKGFEFAENYDIQSSFATPHVTIIFWLASISLF